MEEEDFEVLRDQLSDVVLAGADAMTAVLSSTFWLLSRNGRVLRSLRASIEEVCGRDPPTYQQLQRLTYVRYVINEGITDLSKFTSEN